MEKYTHKGDMSREAVSNISEAAGAMWDWVLAMEAFAKANKDIEPKRKKVQNLKEKLKKSEDELMMLRENYLKLKDTIIKLNEDLVRFKEDMHKYHQETSIMQIKLDRSDKLISGLSSTKDDWINRKH
jgi:dynein heavy chain